MKECEYCQGAVALVHGETNDSGIAIHYPNKLVAYGYDTHGFGHNGITVNINYCPMCGRELKTDNNKTKSNNKILNSIFGINKKGGI